MFVVDVVVWATSHANSNIIRKTVLKLFEIGKACVLHFYIFHQKEALKNLCRMLFILPKVLFVPLDIQLCEYLDN